MDFSDEELPHLLDTVMELAHERRQIVAEMQRWEKADMMSREEWRKKRKAEEAKYVEEDIAHLTKLRAEEDAFVRDLLRKKKRELEQRVERAKAAQDAAKKQRAAKRKIIRDKRRETKKLEREMRREEEKAGKKEEVEIFGGKMEVVDKSAWALPAW